LVLQSLDSNAFIPLFDFNIIFFLYRFLSLFNFLIVFGDNILKELLVSMIVFYYFIKNFYNFTQNFILQNIFFISQFNILHFIYWK